MILETKRFPHGAVPEGEKIRIRAEVKRKYSALVRLVLWKDGEEKQYIPMDWCAFESGYDAYETEITPKTGLYFYSFDLWDYGEYEQSFQITVYDRDFTTPDWIKGGQIYHVFVDRFNRSGVTPIREDAVFHENKEDTPIFAPNSNGIVENRDFFGGNLKGIEEKLPYIKSLGTTVIYLSPVFKANSNHKYDTGDYLEIDEMFGTEQDFMSLAKNAEKLGIRIMLDGVFNHTGDDSLYFNKYGRYDSTGAWQSESSPYRGWYSFEPDGSYKSWWGIDILPSTNKENEEFLSFICDGVVKKWLKCGASAWRLDVADELNDKLLDRVRKSAKEEKNDCLVIGEVWEDASNKIAYGKRRRYLQGKQLDSVMNYPFKNAVIEYVRTGNERPLADAVERIIENYPKQSVDCLMNFLGTHDTSRIITVLGADGVPQQKWERADFRLSKEQYGLAVKRLLPAFTLIMFLPGVPCIFYGDEAGLEGCEDPFNRRYFPWGKENEEILGFVRKLGKIRAGKKQLVKGDYETLVSENGVFIFRRENLVIGTNISDEPFLLDKKYRNIISGKNEDKILPYESMVTEL